MLGRVVVFPDLYVGGSKYNENSYKADKRFARKKWYVYHEKGFLMVTKEKPEKNEKPLASFSVHTHKDTGGRMRAIRKIDSYLVLQHANRNFEGFFGKRV